MKTIVIARHAKSDWEQGLPDMDRPLNKRGSNDAPRMGKLLKKFDFQPDLILSSPAMRALTTAQLVSKELDYPSDKIEIRKKLYFDGSESVIHQIWELPSTVSTVMLFGHNPIQESVVRQLLGMGSGITMPTCAMVCMEAMIDSWDEVRPNSLTLKWFLIPKLIPKNML